MPWTHHGINIQEGRAWTETIKTPPGNSAPDVQIQHPSNWGIWPDEEKTFHQLVWKDEDSAYDNRFYWAAGIEKRLTDSGDVIGLKTQWINNTKDTANSLLQPSDWYITRKMEDSTKAVPSSIATYRKDVRTSCAAIETKIKAANNMTSFKKLFDSADAKGNTTINNWPDKV